MIEHTPQNLRKIQYVSPEQWNTFLNSANITPLYQLELLNFLAQPMQAHLVPLGFFNEGRLEAIHPLFVQKRGPFGLLQKSTLGDLFDPHAVTIPNEDILTYADLVKQEARKRKIGISIYPIVPTHPENATFMQELQQAGYEVYKQDAYVIPLDQKPEFILHHQANRLIRRNLDKANKGLKNDAGERVTNGVTVRETTYEEMCNIFPQLLEETYRASGSIPPFGENFLEAIWKNFHDDSRFYMRSVHYLDPQDNEDKVIGIGLGFCEGEYANFWKIGTASEYKDLQASTALYWDVINWASQNNCTILDTGPAANEGVKQYKKHWGAKEVPFYYIRSINIPVYDVISEVSNTIKQLSQRIRR